MADNHSQDGCAQVAKLPHVTYIPLPENKGFAYANNRALEQAHGDFILFLNPDTKVFPQTLTHCLSKFEDPSIGCVGCRVLLEDGHLDLACRRGFPTLSNTFFKFTGLDKCFRNRFFSGYNLLYLDEQKEYFVDCIVGAFMMIRRQALSACGAFDERFFMYGEDIDLCLRLNQHGYKILYVGSCAILHKKRASSKKSPAAKQAFYDSMKIYYNLHHAPKHWKCTNHLVYAGIELLRKIKG